MAFWDKEKVGGSPRECYTIHRGARVWRYTSARTPQVLAGITFTPANIRRGPFRREDESGATRMTVEIGRSTDLATRLLAADYEPVHLTITRAHHNADETAEYVTAFRGEAQAVKVFKEKVEVTFVTVEAHFERPFPRIVVTKDCQNAVYDERCGADRALFTRPVTITEVNHGSVFGPHLLLAFTDGHVTTEGEYSGGILRTAAGYDLFITKHDYGTPLGTPTHYFYYNGFLPEGIAAGQTAALSLGCNKQLQMCHHRFANTRNFLGFPWLPERNPFTERID